MAISTITLQQVVNYAQTTIRNAPLTGVGGFANEPAFSMGNWVRQFILSPPFGWRWNRAFANIPLSFGTQDYVIASPNFGWLERAATNTTTSGKELEIALNLSPDVKPGPPSVISPIAEDTNGNVTFRFLPVPDGPYGSSIQYQLAAPIFVNLTDTWAPIPDYYYYLIQTGFLAKTYEYLNDARFPAVMSLFVKQVVAANAGLADSQQNVYLNEFIDTERQVQSQLGNAQAGRAGRGLFGQ